MYLPEVEMCFMFHLEVKPSHRCKIEKWLDPSLSLSLSPPLSLSLSLALISLLTQFLSSEQKTITPSKCCWQVSTGQRLHSLDLSHRLARCHRSIKSLHYYKDQRPKSESRNVVQTSPYYSVSSRIQLSLNQRLFGFPYLVPLRDVK